MAEREIWRLDGNIKIGISQNEKAFADDIRATSI